MVTALFAQITSTTGALEGVVTLPTDQLAHRATVRILQLGRITETDDDGRYRFEAVPVGTYDVVASQASMTSSTRRVDIAAGETVTLDHRLAISPLRTQITVTATGVEEVPFQTIPSVTTLDAFDLSESMATSLGEVLDGELGIAKRSFGTGSSRPVVRGFDGDRVLVMQDGVSVGSLASQSGDHGEPIDASNVERIEVVKGPATLLYGSNAVGGVINAISSHQEVHGEPHQGLLGQVSSAFGSANGQAGASFNFQYGSGPWMVWLGGGGQRTGDYDTPIGTVENSKSRILNGSAGFGWFGSKAFASFDYKGNEGRYGIPFANVLHAHGHEHEEEEHAEGEEHVEGEEEHAEEELEAVDVAFRRHNGRFTGGFRNLGTGIDGFELSLNYSDWNHDEVETLHPDIQEIGTTFENQMFSYRGVFTQGQRGPSSGSFGFQGAVRSYEATGEEALSPPVDQNVFAVFALEELDFEGVQMQVGGRIETTHYEPIGLVERAHHHHEGEGEPEGEEEEGPEIVDLPNQRYTGFSGGIGARFDLWRGGAFVANYTHSYRAPALEELYNFGPHMGNLTFEIGDPDLERERSNGLDFSLRQEGERVRGEVNFFYYDFSNFVFLAPTGEVVDGLTEAEYHQDDARFLGAEMKVDVGIHANLWLNLAMDVVDAELTNPGLSLPRIPPLRGRVGLDLRYGGLSVKPQVVMADAREDVFPTETPTAGYTLLNLEASYTIPQQHFSHHFSVDFFNMADRLYRNHVSFIKDLAPEIGRGVRFGYALKFF
jgi:iron complex outermembrane receptor protein